jgi:N-acetylmuramoyl-L-alanine amidase
MIWAMRRRRLLPRFGLHEAMIRLLLAIFAAAGLLIGATSANAATAQKISIVSDRIEVDLDDPIQSVNIGHRDNPDRILIDLVGGKAGVAITPPATGFVKAVRQGQFSKNTARIVLELNAKRVVTGGAFSADGRQLILATKEVSSSDHASILGKVDLKILSPVPGSTISKSEPVSQLYNRTEIPIIFGPPDASLPLVVLDPGHGGHDPGVIGLHGESPEKDIALGIARAVRDSLLKTGGVRVAMTRDGDSFLLLKDRYGVAQKLNAALFVSIHADAASAEVIKGAAVYTLGEIASDRQTQRLASRENQSDTTNGVYLGSEDASPSSVLIDPLQRETLNASAAFAKQLLREAKSNLPLSTAGHRFAAFSVLQAPDVPSVLFMAGMLTNKDDVALMNSTEGRIKIANVIEQAVSAYFANTAKTR